MSAFREHFLDKYFGYRRRYVDHIAREAPRRASLAVLSEIARLGFSIAGNALFAVIFGVLAAGAFARAGGLGVWPFAFALLAALPAAFGTLACVGLARAVADRGRVAASAAAAAKAPPS
jgi:hypothetical protein